MKKLMYFSSFLVLVGCNATPPKAQIPALTPETAAQLLHYNAKAETWMEHVKKQNATCDYSLDIPSQLNQPTQLDFDHIVKCGNRPAPRELDATVSFAYDKETQKWVVLRFSS